jgi:hypothetical protein
LVTTIAELPPGLCQIFFRPAVDGGALRRIADDWQQRAWDAQLLADPKVKAALMRRGVVLTTWREIMRRFDGEKEAERPAERPAEEPDGGRDKEDGPTPPRD